MKRAFVAGLAALGTGLVTTLVLASPARATDPIPVESECLDGWYVNPDEGDRLPEQGTDGLVFEPADLVHHAADIPLKELTVGGTFTVDPDPGENFRFSVEIINPDGTGYATLHWTGSKWFIGGALTPQEAADPETFIGYVHKWGAIAANSRVVSFGVGYTKNPPGEVETTVSLVSFMGVDYDLTCEPAPETTEPTTPATTETTSPPATTTAPATTTPAATTTEPATVTATATSSGATVTTNNSSTAARLPVTGSSFTGLGIIGAGLIGVGVVILIALRIKRNREESA